MKAYETMKPGENLSWCRPFICGECAVAVNEGDPAGIRINGKDIDARDADAESAAVKALAMAVNPDYDLYSGWDDLHIALDAMHEVGCADCPWRDLCGAMDD